MGPYYVSALVSLFGPVDRVAAVGTRPRVQRSIRTGPAAGEVFDVEVPTTVQLIASFEGGEQAQGLFSFDSALERAGVLEVHGTEGSMFLPDPNHFVGEISRVSRSACCSTTSAPSRSASRCRCRAPRSDADWLLDMVRAIAAGRPHVASGELGHHVLDVLLSAEESAAGAGFVTVESTLSAPVPVLPADFDPFARTL